MNLIDTLNRLISRNFRTPLFDGDNYRYRLGDLYQVFSVTIEGVDLEVIITKDQLGEAFSSTNNNELNYVKVVLYRIYEDYFNYRRNNDLPIICPINTNPNNNLESSGLFISIEEPAIFSSQIDKLEDSFSSIESLNEDSDIMGRKKSLLNNPNK